MKPSLTHPASADSAAVDPFACPFCRASAVEVIGRGGRFIHYHCASCEEVWTGMKFPDASPAPVPVLTSRLLH
jgi:transposase-like protein